MMNELSEIKGREREEEQRQQEREGRREREVHSEKGKHWVVRKQCTFMQVSSEHKTEHEVCARHRATDCS